MKKSLLIRRRLWAFAGGGSSSPWSFTASAGVDSITVAPNGSDWDVTMTVGGTPTTVTYTTAQLEADEAHCMVPPVTTGTTTLTADGLGYWFWPTSLDGLVEFAKSWEVDDVVKGTGFSYVKTGTDDYAKIEFVVSCNYAADVVVLAQAATVYSAPYVVTNTSNTYVRAANAGTNAVIDIIVNSIYLPVGMDLSGYKDSFSFDNVGGSGVNGNFSPTGEVIIYLRDTAGNILGNIARTGSGIDRRGTNVSMVVMSEFNASAPGLVSVGMVIGDPITETNVVSSTNTTTLTQNQYLKMTGELTLWSRLSSPVARRRFARYQPSSAPAIADLRDACFNADGSPKAAVFATTLLGVDPIIDVRHDAAGTLALDSTSDYGSLGTTWTVTKAGSPPYFSDITP